MPTKKAAKKSPPKKEAKKAPPPPPKKPAAPKPTYAPPPPKPAPKPEPAPPVAKPTWTPPKLPAKPEPKPATEPEFVRKQSFAERKAAMEALAEKAGVPQPAASAPEVPAAPPRPPPTFVKETSAADRKAAMEKVVVEQGVTGLLSKAPWKRPGAAPAPAPTAPPTPAAPAPKDAPRVTMTKAPLEVTTGRNPPSVVILDSNALMMQFQFHIDIEKEVNRLLGGNYKMIVPQIVVDELSRLAKDGAQKEALEARMAVELAKTFQIVESPGDGDTGILRVAEKMNAVVVTNDKRLRAQLRAKGLPNIYMRSRAFLTIEGHIPGL